MDSSEENIRWNLFQDFLEQVIVNLHYVHRILLLHQNTIQLHFFNLAFTYNYCNRYPQRFIFEIGIFKGFKPAFEEFMDIKKTNAARILDRQKIQYELIPYKVDENDLGAQHVADSLGEDINQVFKTILVHGDKIGYLICVVPGNLEVDLKGAAKVSGNKKIDTVPLKDLTPLTGYIRGGCSPLGLKKNYPIFIHETAMQFPYIYVSAGERGLQLKVAPADLVKATRATVGVIARVHPEDPDAK